MPRPAAATNLGPKKVAQYDVVSNEVHLSAGIQSGKRPQAGASVTQGTSAPALDTGPQSGRDTLRSGFSGGSQPQKASDSFGKTGKQPAQDAAMKF